MGKQKGFSGSYTRADGVRIAMTPEEAEALWKSLDEAKADRIKRIPDERTALHLLMDAYVRLKELGWNDAVYCPKDGTVFDAIEVGSTGIHDCYYQGAWPDGKWWVMDGDVWPSRPALFRLKQKESAA